MYRLVLLRRVGHGGVPQSKPESLPSANTQIPQQLLTGRSERQAWSADEAKAWEEVEAMRDERKYRSSMRKLSVRMGYTAYVFVTAIFVAIGVLAALGKVPPEVGAVGGIGLFGWTWRYVVVTASRSQRLPGPGDEDGDEERDRVTLLRSASLGGRPR